MNCGSVVLRRICVLASHVHICLPYMPHQNHVIEQRNFDKISMLNYQPQWGKHSSSNKKTSKERGNYVQYFSLRSSPHSPNPQCNCHENKVLFLLPCFPPPSTPMQSSRARSCQSDITSIWHKTTTTTAAARKKNTEVLSFFLFYCRWPCGKWQWGLVALFLLRERKDNCPLERDSQFWPPLYSFFSFFAFLFLRNWRRRFLLFSVVCERVTTRSRKWKQGKK